MRIDVARIAALHHYGGVYADSNVCAYCERGAKAFQRFKVLRKSCKIKLPKTLPFGVSNDLILAPPEHPFLYVSLCLRGIRVEFVRAYSTDDRVITVLQIAFVSEIL